MIVAMLLFIAVLLTPWQYGMFKRDRDAFRQDRGDLLYVQALRDDDDRQIVLP